MRIRVRAVRVVEAKTRGCVLVRHVLGEIVGCCVVAVACHFVYVQLENPTLQMVDRLRVISWKTEYKDKVCSLAKDVITILYNMDIGKDREKSAMTSYGFLMLTHPHIDQECIRAVRGGKSLPRRMLRRALRVWIG
jgi:hypothetical protein